MASPEFLLFLAVLGRVAAVLGAYVLYFVVLWVCYLAVMALDRQKAALARTTPSGYVIPAGLHPVAYGIAKGFAVIAYALDILGDVLLSLAFLELPHWHRGEFVVTQRITRHAERGSGWRRSFALWVRVVFLDGFDRRGIHRA